jgi:hypothetical protein
MHDSSVPLLVCQTVISTEDGMLPTSFQKFLYVNIQFCEHYSSSVKNNTTFFPNFGPAINKWKANDQNLTVTMPHLPQSNFHQTTSDIVLHLYRAIKVNCLIKTLYNFFLYEDNAFTGIFRKPHVEGFYLRILAFYFKFFRKGCHLNIPSK